MLTCLAFGLLKLRSEKFDWALAASRARQVFAGRRRVKLEKIEMYHFMGEGICCGRWSLDSLLGA